MTWSVIGFISFWRTCTDTILINTTSTQIHKILQEIFENVILGIHGVGHSMHSWMQIMNVNVYFEKKKINVTSLIKIFWKIRLKIKGSIKDYYKILNLLNNDMYHIIKFLCLTRKKKNVTDMLSCDSYNIALKVKTQCTREIPFNLRQSHTIEIIFHYVTEVNKVQAFI